MPRLSSLVSSNVIPREIIEKLTVHYNIHKVEDFLLMTYEQFQAKFNGHNTPHPQKDKIKEKNESEKNDQICNTANVGHEIHSKEGDEHSKKEDFVSDLTICKDLYEKVKTAIIQHYATSPESGHHLLSNYLEYGSVYSTGCSDIDNELLNGGIKSSEIVEIVGHSSVGKTQFCMTCSMLCLADSGSHTVLYFDTGCSFDALRFTEMYHERKNKVHKLATSGSQQANSQQQMKFSETEILSRITVAKIYNFFELSQWLRTILKELQKNNNLRQTFSNLRLIVIDSIHSIFYPLLHKYENQEKIMHLADLMKTISRKYNITFLITNQITELNLRNLSHDRNNFKFRQKSSPMIKVNPPIRNYTDDDNFEVSMGESWGKVCNTRIVLNRTNEKAVFSALLVKSSVQQINNKVLFRIDEEGVNNVQGPKIE